MKKAVHLIFVVSWVTGTTYQVVECPVKQPAPIVCVKPIEQRTERAFKNDEKPGALAFQAAMVQMGQKEVSLTEREK